jgi:hypothetical protein
MFILGLVSIHYTRMRYNLFLCDVMSVRAKETDVHGHRIIRFHQEILFLVFLVY